MTEQVPEYVTPSNVIYYTDDQLDALIEGIRTRRMLTRQVYEKTVKLKEKAKAAKLEAQFEKKMAAFHKELMAIDKKFDKLEQTANEVRALRLQLGEDLI